MGYLDQPRVRPGVPAGGQWAAFGHADSRIVLTDAPAHGLAGTGFSTRIAALRGRGYVEPLAFGAPDDPGRADGVAGWWATHFYAAEYGATGGDYPQMPDDYTPNRTGGHAISGQRRTHRMAYRSGVDGFTLRMPSATSVKAFAAETGGTFDLPVSAVDTHGTSVSGWVRVTRTGPHWTTSGLGAFGAESEAQVSEAVAAVLEARRPSMALRQVGDLLQRRRSRLAANGDRLVDVRSTFIDQAGYDDDTGTMAVNIRGTLYGYSVPRIAFAELTVSDHPGRVYNRLVKGRHRAAVHQCPGCGRFTAAGRSHTCPTGPTSRPGTRNDAARAAVAGARSR